MHTFFAINRLSAYIDGELPDSEAAEVEHAIAADPSVRDEYERMLSAVEFLRTRGPVQAPPHLHAAILDRVADEPDPVAGFWARLLAPLRTVPMEAVGVVFAVVAVVVLINQQPGLDAPQKSQFSVEAPQEPTEQFRAQEPPKLIAGPDQPAPSSPEAGLPAKPIGSSRSSARWPEPSPTSSKERPTVTKSAPAPKNQVQKKSAVPEQAYVPEWEQQGQDHSAGTQDPNTLFSPEPVFYRLDPKDEHGLMQLQKLVARYGGSLKTVDGRSFSPRVLSIEDNLEELRADVPAENVEAFVKALNQLGMVTAIEAHELRLYGGGIVQVRIQVLYNP